MVPFLHMLLNISPGFLYWQGRIQPVGEIHNPYFLVLVPNGMNPQTAREKLIHECEGDDRVKKIGDLETYTSFWDSSLKRDVIKVFTRHPGNVPDLSDKIFGVGFYTAEHDIPYHERVLTDAAAQNKWVFDTDGEIRKVRATVYDIEITKYTEMKDAPIDIIGYSSLGLSFQSKKDLDDEEFSFEIVDIPEDADDVVDLIISKYVNACNT